MTGTEIKEHSKCKDRYNAYQAGKDIPASKRSTWLTSNFKKEEDKEFDATVAVSKQHKMGSRFPDIYSPKARTGNDINSLCDKPKDGHTATPPEVELRPGNSLNLSKVDS